MTIKQYGGVFGRNPTFNNVTIEGTLTFDGDIDINSDLTIEDNLYVLGSVGIGTSSPATNRSLHVSSAPQNQARFERTGASTVQIEFQDSTTTNQPSLGGDGDSLTFRTSFTERMRIDASGRVGIGIVPETWNTTFIPMQLGDSGYIYGRSSQTAMEIGNNAYFGGSGWTYTTTNTAQRYIQDSTDNAHKWFNAASGTEDTSLSWSERMRIDASGRVGIGTTTPQKLLDITENSSGESIPVVIANRDVTAGTGQKVTLGFGLSRNSGAFKPEAGTIEVGRESDWTASDANIDSYMAFSTYLNNAATEKMRIDASGNVEIKSGGKLQANRADNARNIQLFNDNSFGTIQTSNDPIKIDSPVYTRFDNGGSEAMRIDASRNLLVGQSSTVLPGAGTTTEGISISGQYDAIFVSRASGVALSVNRNSDGDIQQFRKDGTTVGSIGSAGGQLYIGNEAGSLDTGILFGETGTTARAILPSRADGTEIDGGLDIGRSAARWKDLYRSGSTISTSDRNMKQDIRDLTDSERNVAVAAKGLLKAFRFIDRVAAEGDSANIHFGIIAQDLAAAFAAEGLDANDYQVYRSDTWTDDEGNEQARLGICYENLLAFIIAAI